MRSEPRQVSIAGPAGNIETIVELPTSAPAAAPKGIALVLHPHPLFGGTNTNKVVQTLARTMNSLAYVSLRPNFRGVGKSQGVHDGENDNSGESEDMQVVLAWAEREFGALPIVLCGFSFGAYVVAKVAERLAAAGTPAERLILVGAAAGFVEGARRYDTGAVPADTIVIHGAADETVPLENVLRWAEPLDLPVTVLPGADHFFHRRLHLIRDVILRAWRP